MIKILTGQKIAELRLKANITQEQLAEKLYVTRELVSKWETGKRNPDYKTIEKLADLFSVEPDDILCRDEAILSELSDCIPDDLQLTSADLMNHLNNFISELKDPNRSIFIRRYYFMEDTSTIAEKYGIKSGYVRTTLMRTRRKLTKYLKEMSK